MDDRQRRHESYSNRYDQTKAPLGFKEPLNPTVAILFKSQQKLAFVALGT